METPIDPPDSPRQASLGIIKQEEAGEERKSRLHQEHVAEKKTKKSETVAGGSGESVSLEESFTDKKSSGVEKLEQEEGSQGDDGAMDEISRGEAAGKER